jgi:TonB family protein
VEESSDERELLAMLREAATSGAKPLESVLDAVANAARALSGADGIAIGLETNGTITCRARSGSIAPPLDAPITATSGISGACLRSGNMLVCHDAGTDPRVDAEVCRSLGIRAIVVVPVRGNTGVAGLLEAFAARANAFDADALKSLRELAGIVETAHRRVTLNNAVSARVPARLPAPPAYVRTPRNAVAPPASYSAAPLTAEEITLGGSEPGRGSPWIFGAAALTLLLVVAVAWWSWQSGDDESSAGTQTVRAASIQPASPSAQHIVTPKPEAGLPPNRSDRAQISISENAADLETIEVKPEGDSVRIFTSTTSTTANESSDGAPVEPPAVAMATAMNSEQLGSLTKIPTPMPIAEPRISSGVVEAAIVRRVEPIYPTQARTQRLTGMVTLSATIGMDGNVHDLNVIKGSPLLAEAAKAAVRQWHYRPATLNGNAIVVQKEISFVFILP